MTTEYHGGPVPWGRAVPEVEAVPAAPVAGGLQLEDKPSEARRIAPTTGVGAIHAVRLSEVRTERVGWLWPGYLPLGKVAVIDGDPGNGKSTLTLDLAARVSAGGRMPDGTPIPGPGHVLLLSAEDGIGDTIRPRLEVAGADLTRVTALEHVLDGDGLPRPVDLSFDMSRIEALAVEVRAKLIVIDPLMAFLGSGTDSHRDQDIRKALHPLSLVAERVGASVVLVRHMNKSGGGHALYRGSGSIGIIGAARSGFVVGRDKDDDSVRVLACTKSNLGKEPPSLAYRLQDTGDVARVEWIGVSRLCAGDLVRHEEGEGRSALAEAGDFLRDMLCNGPVGANAIQKESREAGISPATLRRAKDSLNVESRRSTFGRGGTWEWALPAAIDAQQEP